MNDPRVVVRNSTMAHRTLRALGFSRATREAVAGEVGRQFLRMGDFYGGTEDQDLWAIAIATAWQTRQTMPTAGGGFIRLRVRWALREAIRQEARAHGLIRPHRRAGWTPTPLSKEARIAKARHAAQARWHKTVAAAA